MMTRLRKAEVSILGSALETRFENAKKFRLGDLDLGSPVIVKCVEKVADDQDEIAYAILVTFRKNDNDTLLAAFDGFDHIETDYRLPNSEEVVLLVTLEHDT
jgi:hypothetical protein